MLWPDVGLLVMSQVLVALYPNACRSGGNCLAMVAYTDPIAYLLFSSAGKIPRLTEAEAEALMAYQTCVAFVQCVPETMLA